MSRKNESAFQVIEPATVHDDELKTETIYRRVSHTIMKPEEVSTRDQMRIIEASGTLDFWNDPEEDIYGDADANDT